jgi:hypothetical protein
MITRNEWIASFRSLAVPADPGNISSDPPFLEPRSFGMSHDRPSDLQGGNLRDDRGNAPSVGRVIAEVFATAALFAVLAAVVGVDRIAERIAASRFNAFFRSGIGPS